MTDADTDLLPAAARLLWSHLPVLLLGSVLVTLAALAPALISPGLTPVGLLVAAVTVGPVWAGLTATTNRLVGTGDATAIGLLRDVRRHAAAGIRTAAVPGVVLALGVLSLTLWQGTHQLWLLGPLAVTAVVAVLSALAAVVAVPLRVRTGAHGRELWERAVELTAARPSVPLGVLAAAVLGVLAGTSVTASLLILVPGPLALLTSAALWTAPPADATVSDPSR